MDKNYPPEFDSIPDTVFTKDEVIGFIRADRIAALATLQASASASREPAGCYMSWNGFNLRGDQKSISEAGRLLHCADRLAWFEEHYALAATQARPASGEAWISVEELPPFEDYRVQAAYEILCGDDAPPEGEHWEGFAARRIVAALSQPAGQATVFQPTKEPK